VTDSEGAVTTIEYDSQGRKHNDETNWKLNAGINADYQLGQLMRFTKLSTNALLHSPMEQMAFGYVKGNPLSWVDPFGLVLIEVTEEKYAEYVAGAIEIIYQEPA
jgi:hypothetical protein